MLTILWIHLFLNILNFCYDTSVALNLYIVKKGKACKQYTMLISLAAMLNAWSV